MPQYEPHVTEADVERIVRRDYSPELQPQIFDLIRDVEVRSKPRVILACLKTAGSDLEKLKRQLAEARGYYREIIGEAEYPKYMKKVFRFDSLSKEEQERIFEADKAQYLEWLSRGQR